MTKIGLIGSGGREHALALALARNPAQDSLYVYASHHNPGIQQIAAGLICGSLEDSDSIVRYFSKSSVDVVVIGPEAALMTGAVDQLRAHGIPAVGATRAQARLESDKAYMRELMAKHVPWGAPRWQVVTTRAQARNFIEDMGEVAVKPVGLTAGKGVRVMGVHLHNTAEAVDYSENWIQQDGKVLLEERLVGEEFSRMAFISGSDFFGMPVAQDFKYAYDNDQGQMTGGMGSYTMADGLMPFISQDDLAQADRLMQEVIQALAAETGSPYRGILYGQFMNTRHGIRLIEFNARFGDPEAINEMILLSSPAPELFLSVATGELSKANITFSPQASVCKYLVPKDYPQSSPKVEFSLDTRAIADAGLEVIYASVEAASGRFKTLGSRTLAVAGAGATPGEVSEQIEKVLGRCQPPELRHRSDVGDATIIQQKIERMQAVLSGKNAA